MVRNDTVWYSTVPHPTEWYGTVWYGMVRYGKVRYGTVRYSAPTFAPVEVLDSPPLTLPTFLGADLLLRGVGRLLTCSQVTGDR